MSNAEVISFKEERRRRAHASVDAMLEAHQCYLDANPAERLEAARYWIESDERTLARVEKQLAAGVYSRGPRKGQPYDAHDRYNKEAHASRLRSWIAERRATVAALEPRCERMK